MVLVTNNNTAGTATDADVTTMKASYAYGPVTVGYSRSEYDDSTCISQEMKMFQIIQYCLHSK